MASRRPEVFLVWLVVVCGCDINDVFCELEDMEQPDSLLLLQTQSQLSVEFHTVTTLKPATAADAEPSYYFGPLQHYAEAAAAAAALPKDIYLPPNISASHGSAESPDPPVPGYVPVKGSALVPEPPLDDTGLDKMDEDYITDDTYGPDFGHNNSAIPGVPPTQAAQDLAGILFGVVFFLVFLAYVLHLTPILTQASMWSIASKIFAAFIAALVTTSFRDATDYCISSGFYENYYLAAAFIRFGTIMLLLQVLFISFQNSKQEHTLKAIDVLGSYLLGFAAVDAFGGMQFLDGTDLAGIDFARSPGAALCGAGCAALLFGLGLAFFQNVRHRSGRDSNTSGWLNEVQESEDDAFAMCIGFLLSQVALFLSMSYLYPVLGVPVMEDKATLPVAAFVRMACGLGGWLVFASCIWSFNRLKHLQEIHKYHRFEIMGVRLISMFLGWCCLRFAQIVFRSSSKAWLAPGDPILQHVLFALVASVSILLLVVLATIVLPRLIPGSADQGIPDFYMLSHTIGLMVALPWAQLFYSVSESFGISPNAPEGEARALVLAQMQHPPRVSSGVDSLWQAAALLAFGVLVAIPWKMIILPRGARAKSNILMTGIRMAENAVENVENAAVSALAAT